jgi:hypothetical protein
MTLLNAPAYDEHKANRNRNILVGVVSLIVLLIVLTLAGFMTGHGWLFSNLPVEHRVNEFLTDIEQQKFADAYGIYVNDKNWQSNPEKYKSYPLDRFTDDWTKFSPVGPIHSHHVDKSVTDGSGVFGTTVIVGSSLNGNPDKRIFIPYQRSDGTLTYPAPHIFSY